jgi:hypothetical protein
MIEADSNSSYGYKATWDEDYDDYGPWKRRGFSIFRYYLYQATALFCEIPTLHVTIRKYRQIISLLTMSHSTSPEDVRDIFTLIQRERRIILISIFVALAQFQYGYDSAAVSGFQSMPGFLTIFGYVDVSPIS